MLAQVLEEAMEADCLVDGGTDGEDLPGVRNTSDGSSFVQVLKTNVVILRR